MRLVYLNWNQNRDLYKGRLLLLLERGYTLLLMLLALPVVILVRLLRPVRVIRFGRLMSRRIGAFLTETEMYLCERDAGMLARTFDIFYYYLPISNYQVKKMWERTGKLHISPFTRFTQTLDRLNRLLPGGQPHSIVTDGADRYGLRTPSNSYFSFTPEEERLGAEGLQELGITNGASFVCFHARDSAYLDTAYPNYNWRYHDFRDSTIHHYIPAAEELAHRGYFMVRMGAAVKEALKSKHPKIIDYAVKGRTEFLDIYLGAKCHFFICDTAGVFSVASIFRRPIVWVNYFNVEKLPSNGVQDLLIPSKFWLRKERRFLNLREIVELGLGGLGKVEQFERIGIEVVQNSPEEITALAVEMDERLKGRWQSTPEDEELQRRFWTILKPKTLNQTAVVRIGAEFLRQNSKFLE